jgi:hypothetical protein
MIFNTSDYKTREDLDAAVAAEDGIDIVAGHKKQKKQDFKIVGSADDLKRLHLSVKSLVYGVKIEIQ